MTAKAPYNFVPVSDKVYFPDWADQVSHDMPFSDGESGVIQYEIEAISPIFVGGVHNRDEANSQEHPLQFPKNADGQAFIPGTSMKGMVRNVMEITSFGKLKPLNSAKNHIREIKLDSLAYDLIREQNKVRGGWLHVGSNNTWQIIDCGTPGRIGHDEIDNHFGRDLKRLCAEGGEFVTGNAAKKNAKDKYDLHNGDELHVSFEEIGELLNKQTKYRISEHGKQGTLVFTGQPSKRWFDNKKNKGKGGWNGKFYEFIFFDQSETSKTWNVEQSVKANFLNAYHDGDKHNVSKDWEMWKKKLDTGGRVPVFYREKKGEIIDFGLSFLYKMPYKYGAIDMLSENHRKEKPDLAELVFGKIDSENDHRSKNGALRGRVQFTHLKPSTLVEHEVCDVLLATPRSSFYPFYLKQNGQNGIVAQYDDYSTKNGRLAGWKRYPVANPLTTQSQGSTKMKTTIEPLGEGSKFEGEVYFHNLRRVELGALLSALTFHLNTDCLHQLGMGKSLGFGKVRLKMKRVIRTECSKEVVLNLDMINEVLAEFEHEIETKLEIKWVNEPQIRELLTLAYEGNLEREELMAQLTYLDEPKLFAKVKTENKILKRFSTLVGVKIKTPLSLQSNSFFEKLNLEKQKHEEEKRRIEEKKHAEFKKNELTRQKEEALRLEKKRKEDSENELSRAGDVIISKKSFKDLASYINGNYSRLIGLPLNPMHHLALKEFLEKITLFKSELKRMKNFDAKNDYWQKHVVHWIGSEKAKQLFDEIIPK